MRLCGAGRHMWPCVGRDRGGKGITVIDGFLLHIGGSILSLVSVSLFSLGIQRQSLKLREAVSCLRSHST